MAKERKGAAVYGTLPRPDTHMHVMVQEDGDYRPVAVSLDGKALEVVSIDERIEEESEWWETEPVYKMHYQVTVGDGRSLTIFRNMKTGSWYSSSNG